MVKVSYILSLVLIFISISCSVFKETEDSVSNIIMRTDVDDTDYKVINIHHKDSSIVCIYFYMWEKFKDEIRISTCIDDRKTCVIVSDSLILSLVERCLEAGFSKLDIKEVQSVSFPLDEFPELLLDIANYINKHNITSYNDIKRIMLHMTQKSVLVKRLKTILMHHGYEVKEVDFADGYLIDYADEYKRLYSDSVKSSIPDNFFTAIIVLRTNRKIMGTGYDSFDNK